MESIGAPNCINLFPKEAPAFPAFLAVPRVVEVADPAHLLTLLRNQVQAGPVDGASVDPVRTGQG